MASHLEGYSAKQEIGEFVRLDHFIGGGAVADADMIGAKLRNVLQRWGVKPCSQEGSENQVSLDRPRTVPT